MQANRKARHSAVKSAAAATAVKSRPTRKSKAAARKAARPTLVKARDAVTEAGGMAVEAVKSLAHKGEELVSKVLGGKKSGGKGKAKKK
jgi:hypothetical protein